jgi:hypothetical protein
MLSFQKHVYQRSIEFLALTIDVIGVLPKGNADLADQLLRRGRRSPNDGGSGAVRFYTHARGSAMEAAAALDTMRVMKLIDDSRYARGIELLEAIVSMLTKMT